MRAISLPFRLDGFGNVATSTELPKIWADRVRSVVGTALGERVMRPSFGSGLPNNLFEVAVNAPGYADGQIQAAFLEWLPSLEFEGTQLVESESGEGNLSIVVFYRIPKFEHTSPQTYSVIIE